MKDVCLQLAQWLKRVSPLQGSHVLFLTNCHATPWQSHIHRQDITLTFLDCSPPGQHPAVLRQNSARSTGVFKVAAKMDELNEQDTFFAAPLQHLCRTYGGCSSTNTPGAAISDAVPKTLVMYEDMLSRVEEFVQVHGYHRVARFVHNPLGGSVVTILQTSL